MTDPELANVDAYDRSVRAWRDMWNSTDEFIRRIGQWTTPWLDESWRDGNPIFSAWSSSLRRGFRIIQHEDNAALLVWRNTFGAGSMHAVDEIVVSCALSEENLVKVRQIVQRWLTNEHGVVNAGPYPRGPLSILVDGDGLNAA